MKSRILTALILIPPVLFLIAWAPLWLFLLALLTTVELGLYEFFYLSRQAGLTVFPAVGYLSGAVLCVAQAVELRKPGDWVLVALLILLLLILALALFRTADLKDYLNVTSSTFFGILYVGLTLSWLVPLRFSEPATGRNRILLLFLVIWIGDICAFFVGRTLGRTPLFPRISPKKTVEGAIGGFLGSLLAAWPFAHWFWQTADLKTVMLLAGLIAVTGQIGDLVESALKRGAGVKDSGVLLPGHGGMLDRIDSLLFGAPVFWLAIVIGDLWRS